jgi:predicted nucleotidyltransferase
MEFMEPYKQRVAELCDLHRVDRLYMFGSVSRGQMTDESDVDLLVRFKPFDVALYFENYMALKSKLGQLLGREVDLLEEQTLSNPYLIRSIERDKHLIYG